MKQLKNRICFDMCDEGAGCYTPTYYRHKDGGIYEFIGFCSTYVDGVTLNLVAYKPKGGNTRYVRTLEHFHRTFKEIKPEFEYQWLAKNRISGNYHNRLLFYGDFETEENACERFRRESFEDMVDFNEYDLVKIQETKRLKDV